MRPLHYVLKVANRAKTMDFYLNVLQMQVLRHEEFGSGCEASCNGRYDGRWSKTMVGYGDESSHFVLELTYNYGVAAYTAGNDFNYLRIRSDAVLANVRPQADLTLDGVHEVRDPNGIRFLVEAGGPQASLSELSLFVSSSHASTLFWRDLLGATVVEESPHSVELAFDSSANFRLKLLTSSDVVINHAEAYGRLALACPTEQLEALEKAVDAHDAKHLLKRLTVLPTPGKTDVSVIIVTDPDQHEICFVGEEGFSELSERDAEAEALLEKSISEDRSEVKK